MKRLLPILGILLLTSGIFAQQVRDTVTVDDSNIDLYEAYTTYDFWDVVDDVGYGGSHHVLLRSGGRWSHRRLYQMDPGCTSVRVLHDLFLSAGEQQQPESCAVCCGTF